MFFLGFAGPRELEIRHKEKIVKVLERLMVEHDPTTVVTGACIGADTFIAHWVAENTTVQNLIVVPAIRRRIDHRIYALPNTLIMEMNSGGNSSSAIYRQRNEKLVELSDKMVVFHHKRGSPGSLMTRSIAIREKKLLESHCL